MSQEKIKFESINEEMIYGILQEVEYADCTYLSEKTNMSKRSVRYYTEAMMSRNIIEKKICIDDVRRRVYTIAN